METRGHCRQAGLQSLVGRHTVTPGGGSWQRPCGRAQLCFILLHPGENPFSPICAWGPCRCRQLKAAGREECGAEQGAGVGRGKDELCSSCPLWFFLRDDAGCLELGSQCGRDAQLCSTSSKGNQGEKKNNLRLYF